MRYNHFQCRLNKTASMMLPLLLKTHIHLKGEISSQYCFQLLTESGGMRRVCFYIDHSLQNLTTVVRKSINKDPPVPILEHECCPLWRNKFCPYAFAWLLLHENAVKLFLTAYSCNRLCYSWLVLLFIIFVLTFIIVPSTNGLRTCFNNDDTELRPCLITLIIRLIDKNNLDSYDLFRKYN